MKEIELPIETEHVIVRPGDTLVVRVPINTNDYDFDRVMEMVRHRLNGVAVLVVRADQLMVYRPDEVVGE